MKDATLAESDLPWQILLELQGMNRTLYSIHSTLKELSYQVDPDWLEKSELKLEDEKEEEEEILEEMTLDDDGVERSEKAKGKKKK